MNTAGWLMILAAVYLIRSVFKGQVLDSDGNFVLGQHTTDTITALITGNTDKLKELNAGTPGAGIAKPVYTVNTVDAPVDTAGTGGAAGGASGGVVGQTNFTNTYTPVQAIARMKSWKARIPLRRCLHYVALAYGYESTTDGTAGDCWRNMPSQYKHPGMGDPPAGALVFWATGGADHIALACGDGTCETTDYPRGGFIGNAPLSKIDGWGKRYGWSEPYFRGRSKVQLTRKAQP